jgi:predicted ATPase/class 3 adenylate cyclase
MFPDELTHAARFDRRGYMTRDLPTGTVTFLFSDIEGSTRLLGQLGERYPPILETHQRLLRNAFAAGEGREVSTEGDSMFFVFASAPQAVAAAVEAQRALGAHDWPEDGAIRVRIGVHTGEGILGGDNYVGIDLHRAARIMAAGHGGQILLSEATRGVVEQSLAEGVTLKELGEHRLKDLAQSEHLYQVVAEGLQAEFPRPRTLERSTNIPPQLTSFVGRRREIEEVKERLRETRLLTLTGPGGTGKTRLSIQVASEMLEGFEDGAFFVALAPISDPALVVPTIAKALGLREEAHRPTIETVSEYLEEKQLLLVLDNFEQVLEGAPNVGEMLTESEAFKVLATSREALGLHGEQEYLVPPLGLPDVEHLPPLDALSQFEAVVLFIDRARSVKPGFSVTNDNAPAIAEICARLDGLPLAIELAAARVKVLTPQAILKRLGQSLALLACGARDLPSRQQTLRGAIDWSYDLLDEQERTFFARLSVFVRGFTLHAAEAVCNPGSDLSFDTLDGVASLTNKSLLRQMDTGEGESRFFMLETIREYASERLAESPDANETGTRHAGFFLALAERAEPELLGSEQARWLDSLEEEHDNLRASLEWAGESGNVETALLLAGALWRFWQIRGHLREGGMRLNKVLALPATTEHPAAMAKALEAAGGVFYWMADWEKASRYYSECLGLRRNLEDRAGLAEALYNLSFIYSIPPPPQRDVERGRKLLEEAVQLYREIGDERGEAKVLWAIAGTHEVSNDWQSSLDYSDQALELFRKVDDRFGAGWALHSVGLAALGLADLERGRSALTEALDLFAAAGDLTGIALVVNDLSLLEMLDNDNERATKLRGAALKIERLSGGGLVTNYDAYLPWKIEQTLRAALTDAGYEMLLAEGDSMSVDEAVPYALHGDAAS